MKFSLLDIFFPRYCSGCRRLGSYLCSRCRGELRPIFQDVCLGCGKTGSGGVTHALCDSPIDGFVAIVAYRGVATRIIKDSKYRLAAAVLREFLEIIDPLLKKKIEGGLYRSADWRLQSIPLHPKRYRERGFNQSDVIAKHIATRTGWRVEKCLRRARHNPPQAQLPHTNARADNIKGVFEAVPHARIKDQNFILVDDVVTTGSTVAEAARVLKSAGARRILVIALAKG